MELFCLNGYKGDKICLELKEMLDFPEHTSIEGGYDMNGMLTIDVGCYHVKCDNVYSATGALYRFGDALKSCYSLLEGKATYHLLYENDLWFEVEMQSGGKAVVTGEFVERPDKENILHFEMETDQSCFLSVIQDIEKLKETYGGMEGLK